MRFNEAEEYYSEKTGFNGIVIPKKGMSNLVMQILNNDEVRGILRYNKFTEQVEVKGASWNPESHNINDFDLNKIQFILETHIGREFKTDDLAKAINIVADFRAYHPIKQYLENLQWDGKERIRYLLTRYLGVEENEYSYEVMKLFMMGAISRIYKPGTKFDTMICLVEARQGGGKSSLARFLAICDEWFSDDIKNIDDEKIYSKLRGHWIIEFSEMLATTSAKSVESIKSFLSRQKDTYRIPYGRYSNDYLRQCVFVGTTNNVDFLPDDKSGNRRFIPVMVHSEEGRNSSAGE